MYMSYIYREREREKERACMYIVYNIYIYIYIYIYSLPGGSFLSLATTCDCKVCPGIIDSEPARINACA